MTRRELMNLPLNRKFELTDGIYNYVMEKSMTKGEYSIPPRVMQSWKIKGGSVFTDSFSIFEETKQDEDYPYLSYPYLNLHISKGGFSAHSDICYWHLGKLKLVDDRSYKKWAERFKKQ